MMNGAAVHFTGPSQSPPMCSQPLFNTRAQGGKWGWWPYFTFGQTLKCPPQNPAACRDLVSSVNMCAKSPRFRFFAAASVFVHRKLAESADTERAIYQSLCVLWETARWLVCRGNTGTVVILVFTEEQIGPSGKRTVSGRWF